ncbi:MAG: hypothetical protein KIS67_17500 [Verrucomicrobiae bacterium]|nr:hypothetical protein [Verrucomicrobiae bacterium]
MSAKYCYWSVADGPYGAMMEHCVRTARACGVFKEFHVLTDRPLAGCECYDAYQCDKADGLFKLHYLKVGMSKLLFDYFIWLDADTMFVRNPVDVLACLGRSPIHVPLEVNLSALTEDREWRGRSCFRLRELFRQAGVINAVYLSRSAFWVVHREAIEEVYELAMQFVQEAKLSGLKMGADEALGYAMQILCADPEAHLLAAHPELWASDVEGQFQTAIPNGESWQWRHPVRAEAALAVRPAIIHLPGNKESLAQLPLEAAKESAPG